jgi:fructan beta-fructosidase
MKIIYFLFCLFLSQLSYSQSIIDIKERLKTRLSTTHNWQNVITMGDMNIEGDNGMTWRNSSSTYMIDIEFETDGASDFGVKVLLKPNINQEAIIGYQLTNEQLYINSTNAGKVENSNTLGLFVAPLKIVRGRMKFQIFVDRTSIEVFANDGEASVMSQVFPEENSTDWQIFSNGKSKVSSLKVYEQKE